MSDYFVCFFVAANPYLKRLSPAIISVASGETVEIGFRVAINSYGGSSANNRVLFVFNNTAGVINSALFVSQNAHNYYLRIPSVQESDSGVYIAMAGKIVHTIIPTIISHLSRSLYTSSKKNHYMNFWCPWYQLTGI